MLVEKAAVLTGVRIFSGAEKQHVLEEMREPRAPLRIAAAAHVDVERCRSLVGVRVGDDEGPSPLSSMTAR